MFREFSKCMHKRDTPARIQGLTFPSSAIQATNVSLPCEEHSDRQNILHHHFTIQRTSTTPKSRCNKIDDDAVTLQPTDAQSSTSALQTGQFLAFCSAFHPIDTRPCDESPKSRMFHAMCFILPYDSVENQQCLKIEHREDER